MSAELITTPYDAITYKIIGCSMGLHRELGPGLKEKTYQKALEIAISDASLSYEAQNSIQFMLIQTMNN
jgi:GxxExxY protein